MKKSTISYKCATHKEQVSLDTFSSESTFKTQKNVIKPLSFEEFKLLYEPNEFTNEELLLFYEKNVKRRKN